MEAIDFYQYLENVSADLYSGNSGMKKFNVPPPLSPKMKYDQRMNDLRQLGAKYRKPLVGMPNTPVQLAAWQMKEPSPEEHDEMLRDFDALSSNGMQIPDVLRRAVYHYSRTRGQTPNPPIAKRI